MSYEVKDSGERAQFSGGMVRDTTEGKINFLNIRWGPMFKRWARHLTVAQAKYEDVAPGVPNWTLAEGVEEYTRFRESAARHFEQWLNGAQDEDHAAAVFFNINGAEYVLDRAGRVGNWGLVGDQRVEGHLVAGINAPGLHNGERQCGYLSRHKPGTVVGLLGCRYPEGHDGPHEG